MRFVFVDEAGTSANEPVTVVVGIIANADEHVVMAERLLYEALGGVPQQFREQSPKFHATEIFNSRKFKDQWPLPSRHNLLKELMSIPRRVGMQVAISAIGRFIDVPISNDRGMSASEEDHYIAFGQCISMADRYIRERCGPREIGTVVAEDCPPMRKHLKDTVTRLRLYPVHFPQTAIIPTQEEKEKGYIKQDVTMRVTRIRECIHWSDKSGEPLLQVADACAYGIRRYLAQQQFGPDFMAAIYGTTNLPTEPIGKPGWASIIDWPSR
jgi:hypothetical protein